MASGIPKAIIAKYQQKSDYATILFGSISDNISETADDVYE